MADLLLLDGLSQCRCHHLLAANWPGLASGISDIKLDTLVLVKTPKHLKVPVCLLLDQEGDKLSSSLPVQQS